MTKKCPNCRQSLHLAFQAQEIRRAWYKCNFCSKLIETRIQELRGKVYLIGGQVKEVFEYKGEIYSCAVTGKIS